MINDIKKTCCFSGHRVLGKNFDKNKIIEIVDILIKDGFTTFLCGMALVFDTECFKVLEQFKTTNDIKIVACVPCKNQSERFNKNQKLEYDRMLNVADEVIYIQEKYDVYCMKKRNYYMVDNSCCLVCYLTRSSGGTYQTVSYAVEQNKCVIYIK